MEISIGKTIKKLRTEKGVTQEELAKYLNITFQSVSKWETEAATPDTMFLPQIAIFFGVSIDDLFSVGDINHFERVDKILSEQGELSESSFLYAKRYLVGLLDENAENVEALRRVIDLYKKRMDSYTETVARYAEQAINVSPDNRDFHFIYARLRGIQWDYEPVSWRFFRFYDNFIKKYPDNKEAQINLYRGYEQTNKYEQADEINAKINDERTRVMLKADTLIRLGRTDEAFEMLDELSKNLSDNIHYFLYEVGERRRRAGHFEKAEWLFEQSQRLYDLSIQPPPMSAIYARAFMYDTWGKYEKAIEMWEEIKMRNKRDYNNQVEGEDNKWPNEMIAALKNKIAQREQG
ncbi:MAG: helix-turn-helix domain-containing protein [Oscillospiraceae bacterium]|nr:helix-turn-helix domain-containing protein [Oscillospiraceae bacterium]